MMGENLHRFDLHLSGYALSGITQYSRFRNDRCFNEHLKEWLGQDHRVWAYVGPDRLDEDEDWPEQQPLLLTDDDFDCLVMGLSRFPGCYVWQADAHLHRRHVHCIREIREALTPTTAEQWAADSVRLGAELERPQLHVADGIRLIHEWAWAARRLLLAIGANHFLPPPDGSFSTPSCSVPFATGLQGNDPIATCALSKEEREAVDRMRKVMQNAPSCQTTRPDTLIKNAHINRQHGRRALRWLEAQGEYDGFRREQVDRYKEGRSNER